MFLLNLLSIFTRSHIVELSKGFCEITGAVESNGIGDLGDAHLAVFEIIDRILQADISHVIDR